MFIHHLITTVCLISVIGIGAAMMIKLLQVPQFTDGLEIAELAGIQVVIKQATPIATVTEGIVTVEEGIVAGVMIEKVKLRN